MSKTKDVAIEKLNAAEQGRRRVRLSVLKDKLLVLRNQVLPAALEAWPRPMTLGEEGSFTLLERSIDFMLKDLKTREVW